MRLKGLIGISGGLKALTFLAQCSTHGAVWPDSAQFLEKVAENAKKSTLMLNLKVQNIYIKPHLKL